MATHKISLELTTEQLIHLNTALHEHKQANEDALAYHGFASEYPELFKQCEALQIFIDNIESIVPEVSNA